MTIAYNTVFDICARYIKNFNCEKNTFETLIYS